MPAGPDKPTIAQWRAIPPNAVPLKPPPSLFIALSAPINHQSALQTLILLSCICIGGTSFGVRGGVCTCFGVRGGVLARVLERWELTPDLGVRGRE